MYGYGQGQFKALKSRVSLTAKPFAAVVFSVQAFRA